MKRLYPVINADSAISDYNKKYQDFHENILPRLNVNKLTPQQEVAQPTLNDHLLSQGEPNYFSRRQAIAKGMGMSNYTGTKEQDQALYNALQVQGQNKAVKSQSDFETTNKDREFKLKEKELGLKQEQMKASKMPTSDDIASSLLKTIK
jgi:hypothetical protein